MNASKRIREKFRPDLLLADIVFDVFSEDGSQGSAGGDGEYLFVIYIHIFMCRMYFILKMMKRSNRKHTITKLYQSKLVDIVAN